LQPFPGQRKVDLDPVGGANHLKKESSNFKKHYGLFKKTVQLKSEKRIDQKTFDKDLKKNKPTDLWEKPKNIWRPEQ